MGNKHNYPSDITREQFELIRADLEAAKKATRPRQYDLYDIFCAVMYVVKDGVQWRMLPSDFPGWKLVYYYFTVWRKKDDTTKTSILDVVLEKLARKTRENAGREALASLGIADSKSIKNAFTAKEKGYDAGKKSFRRQASYHSGHNGQSDCHESYDGEYHRQGRGD